MNILHKGIGIASGAFLFPLSPIEMMKSRTTFEQMTKSEKLSGSLSVVLLGMGIVFLVLLLILVCTTIMSKVLHPVSKKTSKPMEDKEIELLKEKSLEISNKPVESHNEDWEEEIPEEVIAVITAAVVTFSKNKQLVVRRVRRVSQGNSSWRMAGLLETMKRE